MWDTENCTIFDMKTTLNLHDALLVEAKALAARQSLSLTRLIEEGLRMRLRAMEVTPARNRRAMPVFHSRRGSNRGLAPGLSGLSTREMADVADEAAASRVQPKRGGARSVTD